MRPYYEDDSVTLYHGVWQEVLPSLGERSAGAVLTDPPYSEHTHNMARTNKRTATGNGNAQRALSGGQRSFDFITLDGLTDLFAECGRVSRGWVASFLDTHHAASLTLGHEIPELRLLRTGVWVKTNPMPSISGDRPGQGWEAMAFLHRSDVKPTWHGGGRASTWVTRTVQKAGHPSAKPLGIMADWVRLFTDPGELVVDPCAGIGTTGRAAKDEGRQAVLVEMREDYCELAARQLEQDTLFGEIA